MRRLRGEVFVAALGLAVLGAAAAGCATVPMASALDDARMKQLQPSPDSSLIYVYRNEIVGYSVHMEVDLDGHRYGATVAKSYMAFVVPPGRHMLVSHAENDSTLVLDAFPGRRYFVWQEVRMGLIYARSELQLVPDVSGVDGVSECRLVQMPLPAPAPPPAQAVLAPPTS